MRVALTGGASGIGAAVVAKMKLDGHWITSFDIAEPGGIDHWIETDLSDPASIDHALLVSEGPFDVLINNAGLPPREGLTEKVLRVNWFGLSQFLDGILPQLSKGASIVNTASRAGAMWRDNLEEVKALQALNTDALGEFIKERSIDATRAYNLSKEAVIVMTHARTEEMISRGLRMNAVSPAAVSTGILEDFVQAFGPRVAANIARAGRAGTPEEVAEVITFLASPQSNWIKGQDIVIDGGMSAMTMTDMMDL
jgi:NAD(P)-dependent dehydrogenase (short-subunit alcohol dehydrogenase family)